jgi:Ca2+-transporting ATPase
MTIPIAGLAFLPVLFKMPLILLPAHIAFLELIIDPACSTVFEAEREEKNIMQRPPRDLREPLLERKPLLFSLFQGISVLAVAFMVFWVALLVGDGEANARTVTFATLVSANLALILTNLSWSRSLRRVLADNRAFWVVGGVAVLSLALILYLPILNTLFHFSKLHLNDLLIVASAFAVALIWFESLKRFRIFSRGTNPRV